MAASALPLRAPPSLFSTIKPESGAENCEDVAKQKRDALCVFAYAGPCGAGDGAWRDLLRRLVFDSMSWRARAAPRTRRSCEWAESHPEARHDDETRGDDGDHDVRLGIGCGCKPSCVHLAAEIVVVVVVIIIVLISFIVVVIVLLYVVATRCTASSTLQLPFCTWLAPSPVVPMVSRPGVAADARR